MKDTAVKKNSLRDIKTKESLLKNIARNPTLYLLIMPGFIYLIIFKYIPMYGILIAFKDFSITKGIIGSPWAGFDNFNILFHSSQFYKILRNSVLLSLYRIIWGFPFPIILAIIINEVSNLKMKKLAQTVVYLPHFISWVVIAGIVVNFLGATKEAPLNFILNKFGTRPINFLSEPKYFRTILVASEIWKEAGWGTIVYLAAMSGIDPTLYEAATVDGANRLGKIWHITLPGIMSTVVVLLILRMGSILNNGFEQVLLLQTPLTYKVSDVFETYTYRVGLLQGNFSFATAVGFFQSLVGLIFIYITNRISKKVQGYGLW